MHKQLTTCHFSLQTHTNKQATRCRQMLLRLTKSSPCCVFLALISLARCQHAVLSSIIETMPLRLHIWCHGRRATCTSPFFYRRKQYSARQKKIDRLSLCCHFGVEKVPCDFKLKVVHAVSPRVRQGHFQAVGL